MSTCVQPARQLVQRLDVGVASYAEGSRLRSPQSVPAGFFEGLILHACGDCGGPRELPRRGGQRAVAQVQYLRPPSLLPLPSIQQMPSGTRSTLTCSDRTAARRSRRSQRWCSWSSARSATRCVSHWLSCAPVISVTTESQMDRSRGRLRARSLLAVVAPTSGTWDAPTRHGTPPTENQREVYTRFVARDLPRVQHALHSYGLAVM